jgi:hypothetical protein
VRACSNATATEGPRPGCSYHMVSKVNDRGRCCRPRALRAPVAARSLVASRQARPRGSSVALLYSCREEDTRKQAPSSRVRIYRKENVVNEQEDEPKSTTSPFWPRPQCSACYPCFVGSDWFSVAMRRGNRAREASESHATECGTTGMSLSSEIRIRPNEATTFTTIQLDITLWILYSVATVATRSYQRATTTVETSDA